MVKSENSLRVLKLLSFSFSLLSIASCSVEKQIARSAKTDVLNTKALQAAHVGISIFDPSANKYIYNYQGDKYFVPASNTKIPTCYAAMKYLGDSLVGLRYNDSFSKHVFIQPTGDPTFLNQEFRAQKVFDALKKIEGNIYISWANFSDEPLGNGWSWNDYKESYMTERSAMPLYGNVIRIYGSLRKLTVEPSYFRWDLKIDSFCCDEDSKETYYRPMQENVFYIRGEASKKYSITSPFYTRALGIVQRLLQDTIKTSKVNDLSSANSIMHSFIKNFPKVIFSQPTDSVLKPMMHRSDNFFAEQSLLMVSNEMLGFMNDEKIIDTLLKTDFKDLPQKPRWADGSGLSRYNLFTPQDLVFILNKMKNEFGMERLKVILPTGGEGTISNYYKADSGYIYGKTGTLSGVVALSGFLITEKKRVLIFSTLVNNHQSSATEIRRSIEKFLHSLRLRY